jgi:transcriptional regulator with XRE-family HTH domain
MDEERRDFSRRLAAAMSAAGYEPRPSVLFKQFNSRYRGKSVSFQTASRWLNAVAIPGQDKLQVLAKLFGAETEYLRFGVQSSKKVAEPKLSWPLGIKALDRETIDAYLALSAPHRRLVRELIAALQATHSKTEVR